MGKTVNALLLAAALLVSFHCGAMLAQGREIRPEQILQSLTEIARQEVQLLESAGESLKKAAAQAVDLQSGEEYLRRTLPKLREAAAKLQGEIHISDAVKEIFSSVRHQATGSRHQGWNGGN